MEATAACAASLLSDVATGGHVVVALAVRVRCLLVTSSVRTILRFEEARRALAAQDEEEGSEGGEGSADRASRCRASSRTPSTPAGRSPTPHALEVMSARAHVSSRTGQQRGQQRRRRQPAWRRHVIMSTSLSAGFPRGRGLIHLLAFAARARTVVEFGTWFGISTVFLAAAVRDGGGGRVIGSELHPEKVRRARQNLDESGLGDLVEIREGGALVPLRDVEGSIDLVLLDGWKNL
ncbi:class I SAM-dependent methyltransferase [Sorangium sp. So ce321]|uniref:O-methyltransferase n=1 Tax=Sorangium sp. So ce321 TaxID=3133300 RepID=UPI003F5F9FD3